MKFDEVRHVLGCVRARGVTVTRSGIIREVTEIILPLIVVYVAPFDGLDAHPIPASDVTDLIPCILLSRVGKYGMTSGSTIHMY